MKKYFSRFFTLVLLISATILPLSCGIKDLYAGGTIKIKLPGNSQVSREALDSADYGIHHYKITITEIDSATNEATTSVRTYDNLMPGSTVTINIKKAGDYFFEMAAYQVADGKTFEIGTGLIISPDGSVPTDAVNRINVENGMNATIVVKFEAINKVECHEINEGEAGTINLPIDNADQLFNAINSIRSKDIPTKIYVSGALSPTEELSNINITNKNVWIESANNDSYLKNIAFTIGKNGKLKIGNTISLENDIDVTLFTLKENGQLDLQAKTFTNSFTGDSQEPAIVVITESDTGLDTVLNVENTEFLNYPCNVIKIGETSISDLKKTTGKNSFKNIKFTNCTTNLDQNSAGIYNIFTGSDIYLSGEDNLIQSIYLDNDQDQGKNYVAWHVFPKIHVTNDFKSKYDNSLDKAINPTIIGCFTPKNNFQSIIPGTENYDTMDTKQLIIFDNISRNQLLAMGINKSLKIHEGNGVIIGYDGAVYRSLTEAINAEFGISGGSTPNRCLINNSIIDTVNLGASFTAPITINNYACGSNTDSPIKIVNNHKYQSYFKYSAVPLFNITRNITELNDYEFIIDGYDVHYDQESGEKSKEKGIIIQPSTSDVEIKKNSDDPNALININNSLTKAYIGNVLVNHAITYNTNPTTGIRFAGDKLTLEDVIFKNQDDTNGIKVGGYSLNICSNQVSQQVLELVGETIIDEICIDSASFRSSYSTNLIIDITKLSMEQDKLFSIFIGDDVELKNNQIIIAGTNTDNHDKIIINSNTYELDNTGVIRRKN